ncbi:hypothetical protein GQX74_015808 [Glossina fuscipes]|nr:hypothetical protein GQX74_015808 [Glossina fuscipes]
MDFRLDAIYHIASNLGLLQPAPIAIIVGGTNGKGSTCRLIEAILLNSKKTVGVYSSPHLLKYNERIRVQGLPISNEICILAISYINKIRGKISISYFEFSTLVALWIFKYLKLDVVILEVGLGGSLDATNIVNSNISVITNVALEHTQILGGTYDQIAKEKSDVAHNPHAASMLRDKDIKNTLKYFLNIIDVWYCVSLLEYPRGAKNEELSVHLCEKKSRIEKFENVKSAWEQAIKKLF